MLSLFQNITCFAFDVDGVLTDGMLLLMPDGEMVRRMNIKDGYALQLAVKQGFTVVIISGGTSPLVQERLHKLGIEHVFMGVHDKKQVLLQFLENNRISPEHTLFMGDDVPDIEVMEAVALPCCPADACTEIIALSRYVSPVSGGYGCGRDVIEKTMRLQGKWEHVKTATSR